MPYASTTFRAAIQAIATRLGDPTFVRFAQPEIQGYLTEALRTFNSLTGHWRDHGTFQTESTHPFYSLATVLPHLRGYTVTDQDLVTTLEYSLLEPPTPTLWTGTTMFTLSEVTGALQRCRDQFLLETGLVLTRNVRTIAPPPDGRIQLDDAVVTVRRAAWVLSDGTVIPLYREDVWGANHFAPSWVQSSQRQNLDPIGYSIGETPPLTLQVIPPPLDTGQLDLVSVTRGAALNPTVPEGVVLGMPDDWAWTVKYGALASLLSKDGLANDPARADYCRQRWEAGLESAKTSSVVWAGRIDNVVVPILSLSEADRFLSNWQTGYRKPEAILTAGGTLIALQPVPDVPGVDTNYAVSLDLVRNAPIPPSLDDFLQVGDELLDVLEGYSCHLAAFKEGFAMVQSTQGLLEQFYRAAGVDLQITTASTPNRLALVGQSAQEERQNPRVEAVP